MVLWECTRFLLSVNHYKSVHVNQPEVKHSHHPQLIRVMYITNVINLCFITRDFIKLSNYQKLN